MRKTAVGIQWSERTGRMIPFLYRKVNYMVSELRRLQRFVPLVKAGYVMQRRRIRRWTNRRLIFWLSEHLDTGFALNPVRSHLFYLYRNMQNQRVLFERKGNVTWVISCCWTNNAAAIEKRTGERFRRILLLSTFSRNVHPFSVLFSIMNAVFANLPAMYNTTSRYTLGKTYIKHSQNICTWM